MLRPAVGRPGGGRPPRLGLAIPPSPNAKAVGNNPGLGSRGLPKLSLATPMGGSGVPQEQPPRAFGGVQAGQSAGGSESSADHSRTGSFGPSTSNPTSAGSGISALSFASQWGIVTAKAHGTPDPISAAESEISEGGVPMERDSSLQGLEAFDKLSLEKARTGDVEDLDDEGWRIAGLEKRIEEIGNLGEGAGGAVTKARLKGGKTVFALKVSLGLSIVMLEVYF